MIRTHLLSKAAAVALTAAVTLPTLSTEADARWRDRHWRGGDVAAAAVLGGLTGLAFGGLFNNWGYGGGWGGDPWGYGGYGYSPVSYGYGWGGSPFYGAGFAPVGFGLPFFGASPFWGGGYGYYGGPSYYRTRVVYRSGGWNHRRAWNRSGWYGRWAATQPRTRIASQQRQATRVASQQRRAQAARIASQQRRAQATRVASQQRRAQAAARTATMSRTGQVRAVSQQPMRASVRLAGSRY